MGQQNGLCNKLASFTAGYKSMHLVLAFIQVVRQIKCSNTDEIVPSKSDGFCVSKQYYGRMCDSPVSLENYLCVMYSIHPCLAYCKLKLLPPSPIHLGQLVTWRSIEEEQYLPVNAFQYATQGEAI